MTEQMTQEAAQDTAATQQFRSQVGHISRQSSVFFAGTVLSAALGYVFKVYLARKLGAEALGIYALGMTFVAFIGLFNSLGLAESAVRFAAVYRATGKAEQLRALLWRGAAILLAANILFGGILLAIGGRVARSFYHSPELARYIHWFAILMLLSVISGFYSKVLAGYKAVDRRTFINNFFGTPMTMALAVFLISTGWGLRGYLLAQVLASTMVAVLLFASVWNLTPPEIRSCWPWPASLESEIWSFSAASVGSLLLQFVMSQVDKIGLGFYRGTRDVGIYSVAAALVAYVSVILNSVNQIFSPVVADLHSRGDSVMLARLYKALTKWVLGLTLPLAVTIIVFPRPLMRIFGPDFEQAWPILVIGTLGQLVNCGVGSVGLLLWMSGNQVRLLRVQAAMAVITVALSLALIPLWGIIGAAVAVALSNAGTNFWNLLVVRRVLGLSPFSVSFSKLLIPSIASVIAALAVKHEARMLGSDWVLIGISLLGTYAIFAAVIALFGLDSDDRLFARAMWSRIRRLA